MTSFVSGCWWHRHSSLHAVQSSAETAAGVPGTRNALPSATGFTGAVSSVGVAGEWSGLAAASGSHVNLQVCEGQLALSTLQHDSPMWTVCPVGQERVDPPCAQAA